MLSIDERMKLYEKSYDISLTRRTPVIIRIDGKSFHRFTKLMKAKRPFDKGLSSCMSWTAFELLKKMTGCVFGYTQSDEISLVLRNDQSLESEPFFGNRLQKLVSVSASIATAYFNEYLREDAKKYEIEIPDEPAVFDSRVFIVPDVQEVANYLIWRQQDCTRNSIFSATHWELSKRGIGAKKLMYKLDSKMQQELLFQETKINWNDYPPRFKRGIAVYKEDVEDIKRESILNDVPVFSSEKGRSWLLGILNCGSGQETPLVDNKPKPNPRKEREE